MSFPDIHSCVKLSAENDDFRKKLYRLKHQRDECRKELHALKEKAQMDSLLKNYVTSRDVYVQTEPSKLYAGLYSQARKQEEKKDHVTGDLEKTNKLLTMQNQLMRRYEKEVKQNMAHVETNTDLSLRAGDLEKKLKLEQDRVHELERELLNSKARQVGARARSRYQSRQRAESPSSADQDDIKHVQKERDRLKKENKKLRSELKGLDQGFFDEVEDIKFALQQSARLNKEYEHTLKQMCAKFGVPYPHPEKILNAKS